MKKIICMLIGCFFLSFPAVTIHAAYSPDEFYINLGAHEYKEYANATVNIRKRVFGKELSDLSKYSKSYFSEEGIAVDSPHQEYYFFASILDNAQRTIIKYAIYTPEGKRIAAGFNRQAKKESGFNGWDAPLDDKELFNKREQEI